MNFVFISPNFPRTYWNFADRLRQNGANVLGIGDASYDELAPVYTRIGTFMNEKCRGYTGGLITGNPDLARLVDLYYKTRVPFFNGPIDCRLFIYPGCELKGQNRE